MKILFISRLSIILAVLHFLFAAIIFISVQASGDGQAGFAWFYFFYLDYPVGQALYELLGNMNQEPNIRAGIIFGILGTVYWYCIGLVISNFITIIKARSVNSHE